MTETKKKSGKEATSSAKHIKDEKYCYADLVGIIAATEQQSVN